MFYRTSTSPTSFMGSNPVQVVASDWNPWWSMFNSASSSSLMLHFDELLSVHTVSDCRSSWHLAYIKYLPIVLLDSSQSAVKKSEHFAVVSISRLWLLLESIDVVYFLILNTNPSQSPYCGDDISWVDKLLGCTFRKSMYHWPSCHIFDVRLVSWANSHPK